MRNWHGNLSPFGTWSTSRIGGGSAPAALFSVPGSRGFFYDFSDYTTLFQDTAGTQPVTTAGQTVALALDKSRQTSFEARRNLYRYSQTMTNANWTPNRTTVASSGTTSTPRGVLPYFKVTATANDPQLTQNVPTGLVANRTFTLSFVAWTDAGQPTEAALFFFGTTGVEQVKAVNITLTTTPTIYTLSGSFTGAAVSTTVTARIDLKELPTVGDYAYVTAAQFEEGPSVTEYQATDDYPVSWLGSHATQSILASRPLYALHPSSGIRNVANGSGAVDNATYWPTSLTQNGVTHTKVASGLDADGLPYADYSVVGTASATSFVEIFAISRTPAVAGQTFTVSAIGEIISGAVPPSQCGLRYDVIGETSAPTISEQFLAGPFASTTETAISLTATLANGTTTQARPRLAIRTENGATVNYTIRIKAIQFELGSARTNYQFNYANFNIVEAPFAQVGNLLFDGIDDFLVTPTITPGTDKVQVFAGVRKLSDAAQGIIVELTTSAGVNAGSFNLQGPGVSPAQYRAVSGGSGIGAGNASVSAGYAAPVSNVFSVQSDISGDSVNLRLNGILASTSAGDQGTGNYSNAILYIGRRGGTTLPFNGRLYGLVVRFGPNLDAATIAATEAWMNTRTGAY